MAGFKKGFVSPRELGRAGSGEHTFDDLQVSISLGRVPPSSAPTWSDITLDGFTFKVLAFDTDDYIDLFVQTTHSVALSSIIENHLHWTISANEAGDHIAFQITGIAAGIGEDFASFGTITSADRVLVAEDADRHNYLEIGELSALNTTVSSLFVLRLGRVAPATGTDATAAVAVFFSDCHVKNDTFGSLQEDAKI